MFSILKSIRFAPIVRLWLALSALPLTYRLLMAWMQQGSQGVSAFGRQFTVGLGSDWYLSVVFTILFLINPRLGAPVFKRLWTWSIMAIYFGYCLLLTANAVTVYFRHTNLAAAELSFIFDISDLIDSVRMELTLARLVLLFCIMAVICLILIEIAKLDKIFEKSDLDLKDRQVSKWKKLSPTLIGLILSALALRSASLANRVILHEPLETNPLTFLHWRWSVRQNFFKSLEASTLDQNALASFLSNQSRLPLGLAKSIEKDNWQIVDVKALDKIQKGTFLAPFWRNQRKALPPKSVLNGEPGRIDNVVLILLESMSRTYILEHPEVVPTFTQWGKANALQFTRHYATAYRTCAAQFSMLCSLYDPPEYYVSRDFPDSRFRCLPDILKDHGFTTHWITGADAQFDYNGHFLTRNGITSSITRSALAQDATGSSYGADDSYAYDKALETLDHEHDKTFIYLMTTSNHHPYLVPENFIARHPQIKDWDPIKRSYFYSDYQLGEFLRKAESRPWYKNTLLLMAGDHAHWGFKGPGMNEMSLGHQDIRRRFNTTMMMRIPGITPKVMEDWDTSHIDIGPTILDLVGIDAISDGLGTSMLHPPPPGRFIASQDNTRQSMFAIHRHDLALIQDGEAKTCRFLSPNGNSGSCTDAQVSDLKNFENIFFTPIHMYLREQNR